MKHFLQITILRRILMNLGIAVLIVVMLCPIYLIALRSAKSAIDIQLAGEMRSNIDGVASDMEAFAFCAAMLSKEPALTYIAYVPDENGLHITKANELR